MNWLFTTLLLLTFLHADKVYQRGKASYYAQNMNGRRTASGERYCSDSLTAAHARLPFGTKVQVRVLSSSARDTDLVARYGGEEFAVLMPLSDAEAATELDARLRQALSVQMTKELGWSVTFSAGCASMHSGEDNLLSMISRADALLYQAKHAGRNQLKVEP